MRRRTIILWSILYAVVIIILILAIVLPDTPDRRLISKGIVTLVSLTAALLFQRHRIKRRSGNGFLILQTYRKDYPEFLNTAYQNNRRRKKVLEQAVLDMHCDKYEKAIRRLDQLAAYGENAADDLIAVLYFRGLSHQLSGNYTACAADWEELLRLRAASPRVWDELGTTYFRLDQTDDAIRCYESCLLYDAEYVSAYGNLATVYYLKKQDPRKAITYAERAMELKPDLYAVASTLALAWRSLGNAEKSAYYRNLYAAHKTAEDTAGLDAMLAKIPVTNNIV